MNRQELINRIIEAKSMTKDEARAVLNTVLDSIVETVKAGDKLTLVGFGTFKRQERKARVGRNPSTGAEIKIKGCFVPKFAPGAAFKKAVNPEKPKRARRTAAKTAKKK